jgi:endonuclease YncB( thermonuclease family)
MVRSGQALAWYPTGSGAVVEPSYVAEQREAQQSRAGIWRGDVASPLEWRR